MADDHSANGDSSETQYMCDGEDAGVLDLSDILNGDSSRATSGLSSSLHDPNGSFSDPIRTYRKPPVRYDPNEITQFHMDRLRHLTGRTTQRSAMDQEMMNRMIDYNSLPHQRVHMHHHHRPRGSRKGLGGLFMHPLPSWMCYGSRGSRIELSDDEIQSLQKLDLHIHETPRDGNCFFSSLEIAMRCLPPERRKTSGELRKLVADSIYTDSADVAATLTQWRLLLTQAVIAELVEIQNTIDISVDNMMCMVTRCVENPIIVEYRFARHLIPFDWITSISTEQSFWKENMARLNDMPLMTRENLDRLYEDMMNRGLYWGDQYAIRVIAEHFALYIIVFARDTCRVQSEYGQQVISIRRYEHIDAYEGDHKRFWCIFLHHDGAHYEPFVQVMEDGSTIGLFKASTLHTLLRFEVPVLQ